MTYREVSLGELAHIVGQQETEGSPRGLADLAGPNCDRADNLILVCGDEHREIDDPATLDVFTAERLIDRKRRHKDRIHHLTGPVYQVGGKSFVFFRPPDWAADAW